MQDCGTRPKLFQLIGLNMVIWHKLWSQNAGTKTAMKMNSTTYLRYLRPFLHFAAIFSLVIVSASCNDDRGRDGRPGRAYLSLEWEIDMPDYLDAGTPDIPATFEWGRSYRAYPGWYTIYYDGHFWNGSGNVNYSWEMEYEIWEAAGERGGYNYDGDDGPDTYFTLWLSPTGPSLDEFVTKKAGLNNYTVVSNTGDRIEILIEGASYSMRAIFRKVEPRSR